jgi:hypothetical protein
MTRDKDYDNQSLVGRLIAALLRLPWADLLADALKAVHKAIQGRSYRGLYEVLEYESTLELKDREGKKAAFKKREKVRYLRNNVIAYQDQAWGDGEILLDYSCSPGTPVDRYRSGYKTYILISRREVKDKGDIDEFFSGYGLTVQPGTEELLVGLLMIDRPRPADPEWFAEVETTFGENELVAITPPGGRASPGRGKSGSGRAGPGPTYFGARPAIRQPRRPQYRRPCSRCWPIRPVLSSPATANAS